MKEVLGEDDDITLCTLNTLSIALMDQDKWAEAEDILSELIIKETKIHAKHHPDTLGFQFNLSQCLLGTGNFKEAEQILKEVVEFREKILGRDHPHTIDSRNQLEYVIQVQEGRHSTNSHPPSPLSDSKSSSKSTMKPIRLNRTRELASRSSIPRRRSSRLKDSRKTVRRNK
jgi:hypothetical protein